MVIEIRDIDRQIWEEELSGFLPQKIFDAHAHLLLPQHNLSQDDIDSVVQPTVPKQVSKMDGQTARQVYSLLFPGREVSSVFMGWPFERTDFEAVNRFVAEQAAQDPLSVAFMLTPPSFSATHLAQQVDTYGFRGLKPYLIWTEKRWDANITDIIPERLLEVANEKELIITLHLSKSRAIADEENIGELVYLSGKYPQLRWILAHCARSLVSWPLERAIERIKHLPNLWYDISTVTDSDVYSLLFRAVPLDRIMYGSDIPCDLVRGQMVGWGFAWSLLTERVIESMDTVHCDSRATFVAHETLRAVRRAILKEGFGRNQINDVFFNNAMKLLNLTDSP